MAAEDSRVCRDSDGNNVSFDDVMSYFNLKLPPGARHVLSTANVNPLLGEYSLGLRFTTTPTGLRTFLSTAGLPAASHSAPTTADFGDSGCGLQPPEGPRMVYSQDPPGDSGVRAVAADLSDPGKPMVWVTAMDL